MQVPLLLSLALTSLSEENSMSSKIPRGELFIVFFMDILILKFKLAFFEVMLMNIHIFRYKFTNRGKKRSENRHKS